MYISAYVNCKYLKRTYKEDLDIFMSGNFDLRLSKFGFLRIIYIQNQKNLIFRYLAYSLVKHSISKTLHLEEFKSQPYFHLNKTRKCLMVPESIKISKLMLNRIWAIQIKALIMGILEKEVYIPPDNWT